VTDTRAFSRYAFFVTGLLCASAMAQNNANFASDDNRFDGDHLKFRTNAKGFMESTGSDTQVKCAPAGSKLAIVQERADGKLVVRFYEVATESDDPEALKQCPPNQRVNTYTAYVIGKNELVNFDYRRTGVTFGGLVVPFKYRLGGDRGITASTTVAPYVGFRTGWFQTWSLSFTPVLSAGLGLVPVTDPSSGKTETKSAFSVAAGFIMGSSKNEKFNSGILFGRDLLSKADRELDPNVNKWWLSFYVGVSL